MTDGVHAESRMLGDVKFHTHSGIDASTAERWKEAYQEDFLGAPTARMASALGYELPRGAAIPRRDWQPGELRPVSFAQVRLWFLDRLETGSVSYILAGAVRLTGSLDVAALAGEDRQPALLKHRLFVAGPFGSMDDAAQAPDVGRREMGFGVHYAPLTAARMNMRLVSVMVVTSHHSYRPGADSLNRCTSCHE